MKMCDLIALLVVVVAVVALLRRPRRRCGCSVNDLSRWEAFGGTLKRPPPPPPWLALVLALVFALAMTGEASAASTVCRTTKPAKTKDYWSWRQIDGKKCWYIGKRGRAKTTLHWQPHRAPMAYRAPRVSRETARLPQPQPANDPLLASVWPEALPPPPKFDERWTPAPRSVPPIFSPPPPPKDDHRATLAFAMAENPAPPLRSRTSSVTPAFVLVLGPALMLAIVWAVQEWAAARRRRRYRPFLITNRRIEA